MRRRFTQQLADSKHLEPSQPELQPDDQRVSGNKQEDVFVPQPDRLTGFTAACLGECAGRGRLILLITSSECGRGMLRVRTRSADRLTDSGVLQEKKGLKVT